MMVCVVVILISAARQWVMVLTGSMPIAELADVWPAHRGLGFRYDGGCR